MLTKRWRPMTRWSSTSMFIRLPASTIMRVPWTSSALGVGSKDGWLCTTMMAALLARMASRKTSPARTETALSEQLEDVLRVTDGIIEENLLELAIARSSSVRVLFLNACKSAHTSAEVYNNTDVAYSIGWPGEVSNELAITWSRLFFDALRISPTDAKRAAGVANDSVLRSHKVSPHELPIVLNGRNMTLMRENTRLQDELKRYHQGAMRIPNWMIVASAVIVTLLIVNTLVLTSLH